MDFRITPLKEISPAHKLGIEKSTRVIILRKAQYTLVYRACNGQMRAFDHVSQEKAEKHANQMHHNTRPFIVDSPTFDRIRGLPYP